jgi:hypothetical protein
VLEEAGRRWKVNYPIPQSILAEVGRIRKNATLARAFLEYDHQRYTTGTGEAPEIEIPLPDYESLKDRVHRIYMAHAPEVEDIVNGPQPGETNKELTHGN